MENSEKKEKSFDIVQYLTYALMILLSVFVFAPIIILFLIVTLVTVFVSKAFKLLFNTGKTSVLLTGRLLIHLVIAVGFAIILIWGTMVGINVYTGHGDEFGMPDFTGYSLSDLKKVAHAKNLRCEIMDSVYRANLEKGSVIEQYPPKDYLVKENRKVFVTIVAFSPEKVLMPNLVGSTRIQAKNDLERLGLSVGKLEYVPDLARDYVLAQKFNDTTVVEGMPITKGSFVDLILGEGLSNKKTTPPYLIGMHLFEAQKKVISSSLNIGATIYDNSVEDLDDSIEAVIWKQAPRYRKDTTIALGSYIDVWMTLHESKVDLGKTIMESDSIDAE